MAQPTIYADIDCDEKVEVKVNNDTCRYSYKFCGQYKNGEKMSDQIKFNLDLKINGTVTAYTVPANGGVISRNDTLVVAFSDYYKIRTDPDTFAAGSVVGYVATI